MESSRLIHTIPFSQFHLWDVKRYNNSFREGFENEIYLSEILKPFKEKISKDDLIRNDWQIIEKLNFSGELFLRDKEQIKTYKGSVFKVPENSIIYSKINVRHGCVYFHPKGEVPFGVSSEYPTFVFDEKQVNGIFLQKLLQSSEFKKVLNSRTSGISKARVKVDEFLDIKIPLPSLSEQKSLVDDYNEKIKLADEQEKRANNLEIQLFQIVDSQLGIEVAKSQSTRIGEFLNLIEFRKLSKWGVDSQNLSSVKFTKDYMVFKISDICSISSGGTPSRSRPEFYNGTIPWIKTGEVLNDVIYDTEEKITVDAIKNSSAKIYPKDSLIIAMYGQGKTRGRTAKLGINASTNQACAVLFDIDNSQVLTDFLWLYLMNEYDRLRELASGNNQPNLNAQMIKDYPVVVPPLDIQENIISKYFQLRAEQKALIIESNQNRVNAIQEFEKEIFKS